MNPSYTEKIQNTNSHILDSAMMRSKILISIYDKDVKMPESCDIGSICHALKRGRLNVKDYYSLCNSDSLVIEKFK